MLKNHAPIHALWLALAMAGAAAHAQAPAPASTPPKAAAAAAPQPSSPAKKELAARILKIQQAGIEGMARTLAERPAIEMLNQAGMALQSRPADDKRTALGKEIQAEVKKYVDDAVPLVQARAVKLAPTTIGALMEEKFTEDELKQLVGMLESPVLNRFQSMTTDMQKALLEKLVAETRPTIEPKVKALELAIAKKLGVTPPSAAAAAPAKPASK